MKRFSNLILLFILIISNAANGQILTPVKWSWKAEKINDTEYNLIFHAKIDKTWAIYGQFIGEDGPVPTSFTFTEGPHFKLIGKAAESKNGETKFDKVFEQNIKKFHNYADFTQRVKVLDKSKPIVGYLTYMTCDDTRCLPPTDVDYSFDINKLSQNSDPNTSDVKKKGQTEEIKSGDNKGDLSGSQQVATPIIADSASANVAVPTDTNKLNPVTKHKFDKEFLTTECGGTASVPEEKTKNWWLIFIAGFIGGLLAFLTPCVFPMVPLTVSFFAKRSGTRTKGIRNAIYYGLSIIVIYLILGLVITAIFGADALNQLSTNVWFNLAFAILFIIFGISFFGYFEIQLPSSWANKSDNMAGKGGLLGIFFMAFTLALVSFSCTGPIIGTLLVETATGGGPTLFGTVPIGPLVGMFGFSLALALPFALFALFPAWLNSMPKSGSWMNVIKVTLGFIEIALALKFISIADLTMNWKIMPYELFVGLWVLIALAMAAYYLGYLRFPLDPPKQKISMFRKVFGVLMIGVAIYFASGFRVSKAFETFITPNFLSGLAPPAGHSYIYPKHCPLNINCFHDYDLGLAYAKKVNKPVLIDFTGYGCVNCRRMEDNVWSKDPVFKLINDEYVLISLYVDDRKKLDEPYFSTFSNKEIKEVGKKWADFQAIHFDTNSQPYYVLTGHDGKILTKPVAYTPDVEQYRKFLQCGLDKFKELGNK